MMQRTYNGTNIVHTSTYTLASKIPVRMNGRHNAVFPNELVAYIMDGLQTDRSTLMSCAMTCKSWVYLAQAQIFHAITIDTEAKLNKLFTLLKKNAHLALHVRILHINPYHQHIAARGLQQMQEWIREIPTYLVSVLTNLRTLHLEHIDHELVEIVDQLAKEFARFRHIQCLDLTSCKFASFRNFEDLVLAFPRSSLTTLSIDMVSWGVGRAAQKGPPHPERGSLNLRSLQVGRFCKMQTIAPWLSATQCMTNLKELELHMIAPEELQYVGDLLYQLGNTLEHLTLGCKFDRTPHMQSILGDYLHLYSNTKLRTLRVRLFDLINELMSWVPWILTDLGAPSGPKLQQITFDIWLWNDRQLQSENWNEIERILDNPRYRSLKEVTFIQRGHVDTQGALGYEDTRMALSRRFPGLHKRGVLRIEDGKEHVGRTH